MIDKGLGMPQTIAEYKRLFDLYEKKMLRDKDEISRLKQTINNLRQKKTNENIKNTR